MQPRIAFSLFRDPNSYRNVKKSTDEFFTRPISVRHVSKDLKCPPVDKHLSSTPHSKSSVEWCIIIMATFDRTSGPSTNKSPGNLVAWVQLGPQEGSTYFPVFEISIPGVSEFAYRKRLALFKAAIPAGKMQITDLINFFSRSGKGGNLRNDTAMTKKLSGRLSIFLPLKLNRF